MATTPLQPSQQRLISYLLPKYRESMKDSALIDRQVRNVVSQCALSFHHLQSSSTLKDIFQQILHALADRGLIHSWGLYCMQTRIDAMQQLVQEQLCIPPYMTFLGVGYESVLALPILNGLVGSAQQEKENEFIERVRAILVDVFVLFVRSENDLLHRGSDHELDQCRSHLFWQLMRLKVFPLYPFSFVVQEYGPRALSSLSKHLLGVGRVGRGVKEEVLHVNRHVLHVLASPEPPSPGSSPPSQAHPASSSSPSPHPSYQSSCLPILTKFFQHLRGRASKYAQECISEDVIQGVWGLRGMDIRQQLKNEAYSSAQHLVSVWHERYRQALKDMAVPITPYSLEDVRQACKDIGRESMAVNGAVFVGGKSPVPSPASSVHSGNDVNLDAPFVDKYAQAFSPTTTTASSMTNVYSITTPIDAISEELKKVVVYVGSLSEPPNTSPPHTHHKTCAALSSSSDSADSPAVAVTHDPAPATLFTPTAAGMFVYGDAVYATMPRPSLRPHSPCPSSSCPSPDPSLLSKDVHRLLLAYTLLAASRTSAGGDAFLILNDLYGGEGLVFCPVSSANTTGAGIASSTSSFAGLSLNNPGAPDVDVVITTRGVRVAVKERYHLYNQEDMGRGGRNSTSGRGCQLSSHSHPLPLAKFKCLTTTIIDLRDVGQEDNGEGEGWGLGRLFEVLVTHPHQLVHRAVTIQPYL
eukprot:gene33699-40766_t